jgi:dihydrolipoamide dehydrogenase
MKENRFGAQAEKIRTDIEKLTKWKNSGIERLEQGIRTLCKKRNVEILEGTGKFESNSMIRVESEHEAREIEFKHAILDTGSKPIPLPGTPWSNSVISSDHALGLEEVPEELVVIGAGYIGMELGTVFAKLGSNVSMIQRSERILTAMDEEGAVVVQKRLEGLGIQLFLNSQAKRIIEKKGKSIVEVQTEKGLLELQADKVLVALGRKANTEGLGLENIKVQFDENGFVRINNQCQTSEPKIFALGDITGPPLLAHRAFRMGKVCAEAICGMPAAFDNQAIPSVVFSDPEFASVGLTEKEARERGIKTMIGRFPFRNLGRAVSTDKTRGFVKIIANAENQLIIGAQIVGERASELIGECAFAIEMASQLEDLASTIHPHPTFSEALMEAAEDALKKCVDQ